MRPKAHTAALIVLACAQVCAGPLLAKPTKAIAHNSARRFVPVPAPREPHRERVAHRAPSKPLPAHAAATERLAEHRPAGASAKVTTTVAVDLATLNRVHTWEQGQRDAAARSAIAAANATRGPGVTTTSPSPKPGSSTESAVASTLSEDPTVGQPLLAGDSTDLLRTTTELPPIKTVEEEAAAPVYLPSPRVLLFYDKHGHLVVPAPLYGSHEVLLHQNQMADRDGLIRVQDDAGLLDLLREKELVALPTNEGIRIDARLPANRRFSRPWTAQFLAVLARDHYASFHQPLQVDSAVRTVEFQQRLLRTNGNAAPAEGDTASPHLTGQAVDIAKSSLSRTEIAWMRAYLQPLIDQGKIDVEEEFQQACFHISVYKNYLPKVPARVAVAATSRPQSAAAY